jgi:aspartyl-tRNA(Asn)/glutamyl-tRNA(Gln) amidotransferase subunit C
VPETTTDDGPPVAADRDHLTDEDVAKVAQLAMLELTDDELERFTGQLDAVLDLAGQLAQFDLDDVPPTAHPFGLTNVWRSDEPADLAPEAAEQLRNDALAGGPEVEDDRFRVPPALGEEP